MKSKRASRFVYGPDGRFDELVWGKDEYRYCNSMTLVQARKGARKFPGYIVYELVPVAPEVEEPKR